MKRHYASDKRCLLAIEYNKDPIEVIEDKGDDKVLVKAPVTQTELETTAEMFIQSESYIN